MKSVAALAALVASASAINPARYVRIYDAQNDASDFINLQLVTVFGTSAPPPLRLCFVVEFVRSGGASRFPKTVSTLPRVHAAGSCAAWPHGQGARGGVGGVPCLALCQIAMLVHIQLGALSAATVGSVPLPAPPIRCLLEGRVCLCLRHNDSTPLF
jgi:hypothetical protein